MDRFLFRKSQRLVSNGEFMSVLSHKCWAQNGLGRLYVKTNGIAKPRMGISVSKSFGNAVARNRIKRQIREVFRLKQYDLPCGYDYLLIISHKMTKTNKNVYSEELCGWSQSKIESAFLDLAERAVKKANNRKNNGSE